jgi:hypothetical protein
MARAFPKPWKLTVADLATGAEAYARNCTTGDNAKTWARAFVRGGLRGYPAGVRCTIFDPAGRPWAESLVTPAGPERMTWSAAPAPEPFRTEGDI